MPLTSTLRGVETEGLLAFASCWLEQKLWALSSGRESALTGLCMCTHAHVMYTHTSLCTPIFSYIQKTTRATTIKPIRAGLPKHFRAQVTPPCAPGPRYGTMRLNIHPSEFCLYRGSVFYSPALFFLEWEYLLCAVLYWINVIFISQGDSAKNSFWVSEETLHLGFWTMLELMRFWGFLEMNLKHFALIWK